MCLCSGSNPEGRLECLLGRFDRKSKWKWGRITKGTSAVKKAEARRGRKGVGPEFFFFSVFLMPAGPGCASRGAGGRRGVQQYMLILDRSLRADRSAAQHNEHNG